MLEWVGEFWDISEMVPASDRADGVLFSLAGVGLLLLGFRFLDGISDPVAGVLSDRWVQKGRERRTLLLYWLGLPCLGLVMVFYADHSMPILSRWSLLGVGMLVLFVGYTFYGIPYWSLMSDYAQGDEAVSKNLSTLLGLGLLIATAIGFVVTPLLVQKLGFLYAATAIAVPALLFMVLPYFAAPSTRTTTVSETKPDEGLRSKALVLSALKDRRFLAVVIIFAGSHMSFTVMTAAAPFLAVHLLGGVEGDVARLLGPLLVVSIPCFVFVPRLSARFGWEATIAAASILLAVVYATTGGLGHSLIGSPMTTAMVLFALGGPMVAVLLGVEGEAITVCAGLRETPMVSVYFGVFNFVVKAMNGVAIFVAGILSGLGVSRDEGVWLSGEWAFRSMSLVAGGFLVLGVVGYYLVRPKGIHSAA